MSGFLKVKRRFTFGAILGGLGEQPLAVVGALESPLDAPTEPHVVLALRGRDGEAAFLLHGQVRVRVRVLTWPGRKESSANEPNVSLMEVK